MRTNLERILFATLDIGGFDRGRGAEIDHAVGCGEGVFGEEEFGSAEEEVAASPVFEPHGLFGEPAFEGGVGAWVGYLCVGVDVRSAAHGVGVGM